MQAAASLLIATVSEAHLHATDPHWRETECSGKNCDACRSLSDTDKHKQIDLSQLKMDLFILAYRSVTQQALNHAPRPAPFHNWDYLTTYALNVVCNKIQLSLIN
jgi:hypothetical protein